MDRNYITPSPLCDQAAIQSSLRNGPDPDSHKTIATTHIYARTLPLHDCPMSIVVMKARNASGVYTCFTPSKLRASLGMINATTVALALYFSAACFLLQTRRCQRCTAISNRLRHQIMSCNEAKLDVHNSVTSNSAYANEAEL